MAQAAAKYVLAALLALLSTQAISPPQRDVAATEIIFSARAEQRLPQQNSAIRKPTPVRLPEPVYVSPTKAEPDSAVLFQRPPPVISLLS